MKKNLVFLCLFVLLSINLGALTNKMSYDSKPWTRWWWFADIIKQNDVRSNLNFLKENGFGGVEIAWVYPLNRMLKDTVNYTARQEWLSPEWSEIVSFTKKYADSIGLGCDYTFGTLWPFGDSKVDREEASRLWGDTNFRQEIKASWEYPKKGYVIDHLNKEAFNNYAKRLNYALSDAYKGTVSSLFCDSWEVETKTLWSEKFGKNFKIQMKYDISSFLDSLWKPGYEDYRYDYFKVLSEMVINEFYIPFVENANRNGAMSRAQCMGAPVDIIKAYSLIDIPETEAMLYEPHFSRIVASAAAFSNKNIISSETFTCLYGWPKEHINEENVYDLKLVCDALFANGTNQIIWHGAPFNPDGIDSVRFYASVHVGKKGKLSDKLKSFNAYMEKISDFMKKGRNYSDIALYLPLEDSWIAGEYPPELQMKWSWGQYELRYLKIPDEIKAYQTLWINGDFLSKAKFENNTLKIGNSEFKILYINCENLDLTNLATILELAKKGLKVCLKTKPLQAGKNKSGRYATMMAELLALPNVSDDFKKICSFDALVSGDEVSYWARTEKEDIYVFFPNPMIKDIKYPVKYNISDENTDQSKNVRINYKGKKSDLKLEFKKNQSLLIKISPDNKIQFIDITF